LGRTEIVKGLKAGSNQCEIYGEKRRIDAISNSTRAEVALLDSSKLPPVQSPFWMSLKKASDAFASSFSKISALVGVYESDNRRIAIQGENN
jgi:hypothetical protein